jgi:hypothetical protein
VCVYLQGIAREHGTGLGDKLVLQNEPAARNANWPAFVAGHVAEACCGGYERRSRNRFDALASVFGVRSSFF